MRSCRSGNLVSRFPNLLGGCTYQEHDRHVQEERNHGIDDQCQVSDLLHICQSHLWHLNEERSETVHDGASWGEVVERDQRVHLELSAAQQTLHHDETSSLENNSSNLVEETGHVELDLAVRGNDHTDNDEGDISERLEVDWSNPEDPGCDEDGDWSRGLETVSSLSHPSRAIPPCLTLSI